MTANAKKMINDKFPIEIDANRVVLAIKIKGKLKYTFWTVFSILLNAPLSDLSLKTKIFIPLPAKRAGEFIEISHKKISPTILQIFI